MKQTIAISMCGLALFALTALAQTTPSLVYEARNNTRARVNAAEPWTTATTGTVATLNINAGDEVEHRWTASGVSYCAGSWRDLFIAVSGVDYSMPNASTDSILACGVGPTPSVSKTIKIVVGNSGSGIVPLVQYPNGGEVLTVGQTINILWTVMGNTTSQVVRFSDNGGASFADIATVAGNARSYAWVVPNIPTAQGVVRIVAFDGTTATNDDSNAVFTIRTGADSTPPTVSILSPQNGQTVSGTITVSAAAFDNVAVAGVQFLIDGMNLGNEVTAPPYQTTWNPASAANGTHTLTARARDTSGYTNAASVTVTVYNTPALPGVPFAVLVPVTGGSYPTGQQLNIAWQQVANAAGYDVFFAADGVNYVKLNAYILRATDLSFGWTPNVATTTGKIRVSVTLTNGSTAMAESGVFTVTGTTAFSVIAPASGQTYQVGQPILISWQAPFNASYFLVDFSTDGGATYATVSPQLPATFNSFTYTPAVTTARGRVRIFAQTPSANLFAESGYFTISALPPVAPQFTADNVTSAATGDIRGVLTGGGLFSIFGQNLAPAEAKAATFPLPTRLTDTEVLVNGTAVPLLFASPGQINFQAPNPLAGNTAAIQVVNRANRLSSQVANLTVVPYAPALFIYPDQGVWRVIVQNHATSGLVTQSSPLSLSLGRFIVLYGTGFGPTEMMVAAGQSSPAVRLLNGNSAVSLIDGNPQPGGAVEYVGLAPGMAGVFQVNLELPADLAVGQHDGVLVVNGKVMTFQFWTTR